MANLSDIYKQMEKFNGNDVSIFIENAKKHIMSSQFSINEVSNRDKKYPIALFISAFPIEDLSLYNSFMTKENSLSIFASHMSLNRCCVEILNANQSNKTVEDFLLATVKAVNSKKGEPGQALSYAFGFVLATAVKRGLNVNEFLNEFSRYSVEDSANLEKGFLSGIKLRSSSLMNDSTYVSKLCYRYDNWDSYSRDCCIKMFLNSTTIPDYVVTPENAKIVKSFLSNKNDFKDTVKLFTESIQQLENVDSTLSLQNKISQQKSTIDILSSEVVMYQSIFEQLETLLPGLQKSFELKNKDEVLKNVQTLISNKNKEFDSLKAFKEEEEERTLRFRL